MQTTQLDNGTRNIYATEPNLYYAEFPFPEQQRQYAFQGAVAILLVGALFLVCLAVS